MIFGDRVGWSLADTILETLRERAQLTRTELHAPFGRHRSATEIDEALNLLAAQGLVTPEARETAGRSAEVWRVA